MLRVTATLLLLATALCASRAEPMATVEADWNGTLWLMAGDEKDEADVMFRVGPPENPPVGIRSILDRLDQVETTVDTKATSVDLSTLADLVDTKATIADMGLKADQSTVSTLQTQVNGKADQTTVTALQGVVDGKADQSDVTTLQTNVGTLTTDVNALKGFVESLKLVCTGASKLVFNPSSDKYDCECPASMTPGQKWGIRTVGFQLAACSGCDHDINDVHEAAALVGYVRSTGFAWLPTGTSGMYQINKYHEETVDRVDFSGGTGNFPDHIPYPGGFTGDDFIMVARTYLFIPKGTWTIGAGSDDGRYLRLEMATTFTSVYLQNDFPGGGAGTNEMGYQGTTGHEWSTGTFTLEKDEPCAFLEAYFFERGGGDSFEIAIAPGDRSQKPSNDGTWKILKDNVHGWRVL